MYDLRALLPVLVGVVAGFLLRRGGLVDRRDGESIFKLVFYLLVPAVTFTSLSTVDLEVRYAIYPATAIAMVAVGYLGGRLVVARTGMEPVQAAVVLSAGMVVNTSFQLPFVQLVYGAEGVARIAAFDVVNTVATFTLSYLVAARGNQAHHGRRIPLDRLVRNPALYAIAAALLVNVAGIELPAVIADPVAALGAITPVLIPIGIGILFDPIGKALGKPVLMVATRLVTALAVAVAVVLLLDLPAADRTVLLLIGAAPMVFAAVAFASFENLDVRLATTALSLSLVVSVVLSTLIIWLSA